MLDRDGVINPMWYDPDHGTIDSPYRMEQFSLLPGAGEAIRRFRRLGFAVAVVSNQPGIGKGKVSAELLQQITDYMERLLAEEGASVDAIYYCLHHPAALLPEYRVDCDCRKPLPGLLLRAGQELDLDLTRSYMIGDGMTDVQAGQAAGCTTVWLGHWKCDICATMGSAAIKPDMVAENLAEASNLIWAREMESSATIS